MKENDTLMYWVTGASVAMFVASLIVVPIVLVRLPADFFSKARQRQRSRSTLTVKIIKNIVGWVFILLGLAMLVLPGQGLLVMLLGIALADFPGKLRLQRWIISRRKILSGANWLRKKFHKPPLEVDAAS